MDPGECAAHCGRPGSPVALRSQSPSSEDVFDKEERLHFANIVAVFRSYRTWALSDLARRCGAISRLGDAHKAALRPSFEAHATQLRQCIEANATLLDSVLSHVDNMFLNVDGADDHVQPKAVTEFNVEKLRSTLREICRDWSADGAAERSLSLDVVRAALVSRFGHLPAEERRKVRVCVPGAGLARLAWDVAKMGFSCHANECSLFMLFVANLVLNHTKGIGAHTVFPWIHQHSNVSRYDDMTRPVAFPDVDPTDLPRTPNGCNPLFSMDAGDFLQVYSQHQGYFDAVLTVFFLDTAKNPLEYIDCIKRILVDGGYWINFGPLLYHYADINDPDAIELPYEEIRRQIVTSGFQFEEEKQDLHATYSRNDLSMMQYSYRSWRLSIANFLKCLASLFEKASLRLWWSAVPSFFLDATLMRSY